MYEFYFVCEWCLGSNLDKDRFLTVSMIWGLNFSLSQSHHKLSIVKLSYVLADTRNTLLGCRLEDNRG